MLKYFPQASLSWAFIFCKREINHCSWAVFSGIKTHKSIGLALLIFIVPIGKRAALCYRPPAFLSLNAVISWILFRLDPISKNISSLKKHQSFCAEFCFWGEKNKQPLDDFCCHENDFTLEHGGVGMDFIIHYSNLLLELYLWVNTIKGENADILQLGVNENAILASICITVGSLERLGHHVFKLASIILFFWPVLWNTVISILGRL